MPNESRALLTSLYHAAVGGASPVEKTRIAVTAWLEEAKDRGESDAPIRLFAMGKAATAMTAGALQALGAANREPLCGVVICAHQSTDAPLEVRAFPESFTVHVGDHPVPGPASLDAGEALSVAVHEIHAGDVALVLISGGTTALAAAPVAALSLTIGDVEQAQARIANLADTLLESGLAIHEMNAIRRRVLRWGAGRLAVALHARGARAIPVFAISDVIGDDPAVIGSGPCSPDALDDATFLALLDAHHVRSTLERDMSIFLGLSGSGTPPVVPAVTHPAFELVRYQIVARNADAVSALAAAARRAGVTHVTVESHALTGEAALLGTELTRRALSTAATTDAGESALIAFGGEPVVHLRDTYQHAFEASDDDDQISEDRAEPDDGASPGWPGVRTPDALTVSGDEPMSGGRMQVLALAAALALEAATECGDRTARRITLLAAGTDGRDGPTDAAGAIVDGVVPALARRAGRQPERDLLTGRSWFPLNGAEALLRTGPTGTNVMDIVAILISPV